MFATIGGLLGLAAGQTLFMRTDAEGKVLARAGWAAAFFWVLGMGSRFAFIFWFNHGGRTSIAHFSAQHSITSGETWTVALLAMAVFEVVGRTALAPPPGASSWRDARSCRSPELPSPVPPPCSLYRLNTRNAKMVRLIGIALISWSVFIDPHHGPALTAGPSSFRSRWRSACSRRWRGPRARWRAPG